MQASQQYLLRRQNIQLVFKEGFIELTLKWCLRLSQQTMTSFSKIKERKGKKIKHDKTTL